MRGTAASHPMSFAAFSNWHMLASAFEPGRRAIDEIGSSFGASLRLPPAADVAYTKHEEHAAIETSARHVRVGSFSRALHGPPCRGTSPSATGHRIGYARAFGARAPRGRAPVRGEYRAVSGSRALRGTSSRHDVDARGRRSDCRHRRRLVQAEDRRRPRRSTLRDGTSHHGNELLPRKRSLRMAHARRELWARRVSVHQRRGRSRLSRRSGPARIRPSRRARHPGRGIGDGDRRRRLVAHAGRRARHRHASWRVPRTEARRLPGRRRVTAHGERRVPIDGLTPRGVPSRAEGRLASARDRSRARVQHVLRGGGARRGPSRGRGRRRLRLHRGSDRRRPADAERLSIAARRRPERPRRLRREVRRRRHASVLHVHRRHARRSDPRSGGGHEGQRLRDRQHRVGRFSDPGSHGPGRRRERRRVRLQDHVGRCGARLFDLSRKYGQRRGLGHRRRCVGRRLRRRFDERIQLPGKECLPVGAREPERFVGRLRREARSERIGDRVRDVPWRDRYGCRLRHRRRIGRQRLRRRDHELGSVSDEGRRAAHVRRSSGPRTRS